MIRVLLFEDNKNYREALTDAFQNSNQIYLTKAFENAKRALQQTREYKPDVVLMDIVMPGKSGLDALNEIKKYSPDTKILIQTQFEDEHRIFVALCRGASGYILKSDSFAKIETAIIDVYSGGGYFSPSIANKIRHFFITKEFQVNPEYTPLTNREHEVLSYLAKSYTYQQIADAMNLSYEGVHSHIKSIYRKLHVSSKSEAILKAIEAKLV